MNIPVQIKLPKLWSGEFTKTEWGPINFIVGANGTGKSLFATELKNILSRQYKTRLLSAERLAGLEKTSYSYSASESSNDGFSKGFNIAKMGTILTEGEERNLAASAIVILKKRLDIRIKIEGVLSDLFNKTIRLSEEGGYIKPKVQNIENGNEYGLKEDECHGMKEIISLLTFLYDEDIQCIIFDEPELHLHPQFQSFFLNEIRKLAGDPKSEVGNKIFFIITHSPYFIDIRNLDELQHILVCHNHQMPTYIQAEDLDAQDKYVLKKFLPRFNTHHKQFFFSPNPVFVEGYTDQQIISLLFEKIGLNIAASGASMIDVGGKDELAVFYKLCALLHINCRIIADYDAFYRGKLRETICNSEQIQRAFITNAFGNDVAKNIGELERLLINISDELKLQTSTDPEISTIINKLINLYREKDKNRSQILDVIHLSLYRIKDKITNLIPQKKDDIDSFVIRHSKYIECIKAGNIFVIPDGELEHFFKSSTIDFLNITQKDKLFESERDFIMQEDNVEHLQEKYDKLLLLLKDSIPTIEINMLKHITYAVIDWIQKVQNAINRNEVKDIQSLRTNARVEYSTYSQILECKDGDFTLNPDNTFSCTISLKSSVVGEEKQITFSDKTTPRNFKIE